MRGIDLRSVQELMGHQTITMTLRYSHFAPGHLLEAVQRLSGGGGDSLSDSALSRVEEAAANLA